MKWISNYGLGGIQQLRGPNFDQFRPPPFLEWTSVDILQPPPLSTWTKGGQKPPPKKKIIYIFIYKCISF